MLNRIRIGSRGSKLAMYQAELVKSKILERHPNFLVEIIKIVTSGDQITDRPLYEIEGKELFIKELEQSLLEKDIDIAVHSLKDVPANVNNDFALPCVLEREEPRDAFISFKYQSINDLPSNALIGTTSLRRMHQFKKLRPDSNVKPLRGNIDTRLEKLKSGEFAAIILAGAGLRRLQISEPNIKLLNIEAMIPSAGQGVIAIECLFENIEMLDFLSGFEHKKTRTLIEAERSFINKINGNCRSPIGGHAYFEGNRLNFLAYYHASVSGKDYIEKMDGEEDEAEELGNLAATRIIEKLNQEEYIELFQ